MIHHRRRCQQCPASLLMLEVMEEKEAGIRSLNQGT
jgi:hypothetical protein